MSLPPRASGGPRSRRKALAARADHSEYLICERAALRADADEAAPVVGHVYPGEIVACVQRIGLYPACWIYAHRLRRFPPKTVRSGWVREYSQLGLCVVDKLLPKECTTPAAIGELKMLCASKPAHERSRQAVEERIAGLEVDALHRGGYRSVARIPVQEVPSPATAASASLSLHTANAEHQRERIRAQQRQRLASGSLAILSGRAPHSSKYWNQHGHALHERQLVDPATVRQLHADLGVATADSQKYASAATMHAQDVPPMLQRLLQVRLYHFTSDTIRPSLVHSIELDLAFLCCFPTGIHPSRQNQREFSRSVARWYRIAQDCE